MYGHFLKFQKNAQADEICVLSTPQRKNGTGELFSSTSRPRIDYMQSIRSSRAALTVVADLPRFVFSPENIDTNLCVYIFPGSVQKTTQINSITESELQNRQHQAVVCRIAPLRHSVDLYESVCRMVRKVQKTEICV